jgi:2'-5' RNA ligase
VIPVAPRLTRSILLFPRFENEGALQRMRLKYDPLTDKIPLHLIVFPFESELSTEQLRDHVKESVAPVTPFSLILRGITGTPEGYLFLGVKRGNDEIIRLHDRLYTGVLAPFYYRNVSYVPHLTVGRLTDELAFAEALADTADFQETFATMIHEVAVEIIGQDDSSVVEFKVPFRFA